MHILILCISCRKFFKDLPRSEFKCEAYPRDIPLSVLRGGNCKFHAKRPGPHVPQPRRKR